jgi:purine-binding chemotaxis protein CheW
VKQEELMGAKDATGMTQYLAFTLAEEVFALEISKVLEVLDYSPVTRVPRLPDFMLGVINLRGSVVPVVDLRLKFGMTKTEKTVNTCIIITEVSVKNEPRIIGTLVDSVKEVIDLRNADLGPAPKIGMRLDIECIKGMATCCDGLVIILDIDRVFSFNEPAIERTSATGNQVKTGFAEAV